MKLTRDFIRSFILNAKKEKEQAEQLLKHHIEAMSIAVSNNFSIIEQFFRYSLPGYSLLHLNTSMKQE